MSNEINNGRPKSILDVTLADIHRETTRETARDTVGGMGSDHVNIRNLATEVEVLEAKQTALAAEGRSLNRAEAATLDSRRKSLAFQEEAYAAQNQLTPGMERRDAVAMNAGSGADQQFLESARKSNLSTAILRAQREHGITKMEAMQLVERQIEVDGEAAVLPQYASVKARLTAKYQPAPEASTAPATARTGPPAGPTLAQVEATIARCEAAGVTVDDDVRALADFLRSKQR